MIVLVGESASGKSTIERELVKFGYRKLVAYTTRQPRKDERDGVAYRFVSDEEFNRMKREGKFAEFAMYKGWQYGTAKEDCTDDKIAVLTPHGLRQLRKNPELDIISFYIKVDRRDRLIKILQRGDDIEEAYRRSLSDVGQFDGIEDEVVYTIENDGYKKSAYEIAREIDAKIRKIIEVRMN